MLKTFKRAGILLSGRSFAYNVEDLDSDPLDYLKQNKTKKHQQTSLRSFLKKIKTIYKNPTVNAILNDRLNVFSFLIYSYFLGFHICVVS